MIEVEKLKELSALINKARDLGIHIELSHKLEARDQGGGGTNVELSLKEWYESRTDEIEQFNLTEELHSLDSLIHALKNAMDTTLIHITLGKTPFVGLLEDVYKLKYWARDNFTVQGLKGSSSLSDEPVVGFRVEVGFGDGHYDFRVWAESPKDLPECYKLLTSVVTDKKKGKVEITVQDQKFLDPNVTKAFTAVLK